MKFGILLSFSTNCCLHLKKLNVRNFQNFNVGLFYQSLNSENFSNPITHGINNKVHAHCLMFNNEAMSDRN